MLEVYPIHLNPLDSIVELQCLDQPPILKDNHASEVLHGTPPIGNLIPLLFVQGNARLVGLKTNTSAIYPCSRKISLSLSLPSSRYELKYWALANSKYEYVHKVEVYCVVSLK